MPKEYAIRNWREFQHYSDRNPPWIKLHLNLLTSSDWVMSSDETRLLAIVCMLIGSRNEGVIPNDPEYIQRVAYLSDTPDLSALVSCGFLVDASVCEQKKADATVSVSVLKNKEREKKLESDVSEILEYLCSVTGKRFTNDSEIRACLKRDRPTVEDAKLVIDYKWEEWKDTEMRKHLNPTTPFRKKHFMAYLDEAKAWRKPELAKELPEL